MSLTNWTNVTNPAQYLTIANDNSYGMFWLVTLFLVWCVLIVSFIGFGLEVAIVAASFMCFVLSLFLVYAGLVSWAWCLFFIGCMIFMMLYIVWNSSRDS